MNRLLLFSFLTLCSFFLFSCAQTIHLHPISDESAYFDGKEVVKAERDSIKIVTSYNGSYDKYMVFDIEIFNNSDKALRISPKNFTAVPLDSYQNPLLNFQTNQTYLYNGIDPQEELWANHLAVEKQNKQLHTAHVVNTALVVGGLIAILAGASSGRHSELKRANTTIEIGETMIRAASFKRIIDHQNYYSNMDKLSQQERVWQQQQFTPTTLAPHTSLRGNVFIRYVRAASFVQLSYPTLQDSITFLFKQSLE